MQNSFYPVHRTGVLPVLLSPTFWSDEEFEYEKPTPAGESRNNKLASASQKLTWNYVKVLLSQLNSFNTSWILQYHTFIPSMRAQGESPAIGLDTERAHFLRCSVSNGRAARPAVEPQYKWLWFGLFARLHQPIEKGPAHLRVHGDIPRVLWESHIQRLPRKSGDPVSLLLFRVFEIGWCCWRYE